MSAGELQLLAANEVPVGAGLAGEAVVAMRADSDRGTLLERLGHFVRARRHHLLRGAGGGRARSLFVSNSSQGLLCGGFNFNLFERLVNR